MQEEYTGTLLEDGHIHIPQEIIDKLKIYRGSKVRVTVKVERKISKDTIIALATPSGVGAIAIMRLSGKDSIKIVNQFFCFLCIDKLCFCHTTYVINLHIIY